MPTPRKLRYLDHNATTPLAPEVRAAMVEALDAFWGNPSSTHAVGRQAREAVESARRDVAALLGALPEEIVFTSGGTEGDNLAIRGLAIEEARRLGLGRTGRPAHVVSSPLEHPAVLGAIAELEREGFDATLLPVSARGELDAADLRAAFREETVLVSLALANHELGNVSDVAALAAVARAGGTLFHTDAVQAAGKIPIDVRTLGVDALTISAHKVHGPKGVGAVYFRRGSSAHPLISGGHQEREWRGGTENVAGIVGFGVACRLVCDEPTETPARIRALRDRLEARLLALPGARLHGLPEARVPGTTNVGFAGADGRLVAINLDLEGTCVSTGAACTSGTVEPSPVIRALGYGAERAREAVRFSLGRGTTEEEIDDVVASMPAILDRVRRAGRGP